ncbi:uncharacterized protein LOC132445693 [Gadus macrocephalus]|uniref:uncharacterized protein LOC132445693 n=1 Tax=Gadus macrocephalus TaxID=80720 RepID=UPI0028CBA5F0|nr:uncharacterized protein LOC132445693 [Gadus macrocephalus]
MYKWQIQSVERCDDITAFSLPSAPLSCVPPAGLGRPNGKHLKLGVAIKTRKKEQVTQKEEEEGDKPEEERGQMDAEGAAVQPMTQTHARAARRARSPRRPPSVPPDTAPPPRATSPLPGESVRRERALSGTPSWGGPRERRPGQKELNDRGLDLQTKVSGSSRPGGGGKLEGKEERLGERERERLGWGADLETHGQTMSVKRKQLQGIARGLSQAQEG